MYVVVSACIWGVTYMMCNCVGVLCVLCMGVVYVCGYVYVCLFCSNNFLIMKLYIYVVYERVFTDG